ncbi:NAD(P)H-dependent oxidoreductase [Herbaspirillum sp. C9C3]|uniref:FMN-dependent NADH-azoreductase n=1 Tax=Herbaspirillum sp. C9C3 TaxID=2735271 RepID=UPI001584D9C4|nr:NAD(P)H-dependent oxidoreductase [Herbaspirillum sp. C9C3]NUT62526.1 flavodoxin family protein [Herbaspirillum sp. C9C3]
MKILHINSSSRSTDSRSLQLAEVFLCELKKRKAIEVDRFDLFSGKLPEFGELAVSAKMALFTGAEAATEQKRAWAGIREVFDRFASADAYVINVPLWNNGLPYILKQFIDVVTQPGWAFGFDLEKGYSGLLKNKKACIIHASGVYHHRIPVNFGSDFSTPYLTDWLKFVGVEDIQQIHFAPTVVNPDFEQTRQRAEQQAVEIASNF